MKSFEINGMIRLIVWIMYKCLRTYCLILNLSVARCLCAALIFTARISSAALAILCSNRS
jgi:hypothetical protein